MILIHYDQQSITFEEFSKKIWYTGVHKTSAILFGVDGICKICY